ncbi:MAG: ABC transporter ATP-binding protein [Rhizobiaceae bacterium]|nr:ABC transporter ATP-binding protein [Rhizobiaceae bacterium]
MLEVRNLAVSYGRHRALEGVSVRVAKGEICVILGANGAGKSTLLKAIAGMVRAEPGGEITMNGTRILAMKPHRIVEEGIALVPEGRGIFGDLTVAENLGLGAFAGRARRDESERLDGIYRLFPRLAERKRQIARTMSGGEQQMVAIGRALMSRPEILMLDEPSLGLSPILTQELFRALKAIAATGVGILLVEQNAKQSLKIAGRGYLIENGAVTGENSAEKLMRDPAVVNAYLGGAGGRARRPAIALPPPMRLPVGLQSMGALLSDVAARAGRIQHAFVRAMRQGSDLPSAFVGRYDPKLAGDPWAEAAAVPPPGPSEPPRASEDARRLGDIAANLAALAAERQALHIRMARLTASRPSAFVRTAAADARATRPAPDGELPGSSEIPAHAGGDADLTAGDDAPHLPETIFADLAARAAERSAAFLRARRAATPRPSAFGEPPPDAGTRPVLKPARRNRGADEAEPKSLNGSHGLIGHNSAQFAPAEPAETAKPAAAQGFSISDLAARAATIHAAHVAERRKTLTAFVIPAPDTPAPVDGAAPTDAGGPVIDPDEPDHAPRVIPRKKSKDPAEKRTKHKEA